MKRLVIIFTLAIILFAIPNQGVDQPPVTVSEMSQIAATEQTGEMPEKSTERAVVQKTEESMENNYESIQTENKAATKAKSAVQETSMKECNEESEVQKAAEPENTVECVDKGDQTFAKYKPQPSGQPNPFENAPPTEIADHPVEDLIGEGEDRPGEGKHF